MRKILLVALAIAAPACASVVDSVKSHAVDATGDVAGSAIEKTGDRATDAALDTASRRSDSSDRARPAANAVTHLDADDVLIKDGDTYLVGKVLSSPAADGTAQVLLIAEGRKMSTKDFVKVRAPSKTELTLGADVFYSQDDDVRRGRWAKGSVTDTRNLSSNKVDAGGAQGLDVGGQVAVPR